MKKTTQLLICGIFLLLVGAFVARRIAPVVTHEHHVPRAEPGLPNASAPDRADANGRPSTANVASRGETPRFALGTSVAPLVATTSVEQIDYRLSVTEDLRLDRDPEMGTPRFVRRRSAFLGDAAPGADPAEIAAAFLDANGRTFTLHPTDIEPPNARRTRDVRTRHNGMRSLTWQQQHEGVDIFGATFILHLDKNNRIINVSSRALHIPCVRFHDVVKVTETEAAAIAGKEANGEEALQLSAFIPQPSPIWYPLDQISVVKAWDVMVEVGRRSPNGRPGAGLRGSPPYSETHRLIIRADTGEVVEDINLTWTALEPATFNVYTNDSPEPSTPGTDTPTNGVPVEAPRTSVTLMAIDTKASPEGWIPDGQNTLLGNNAHVYADWDDNDNPDGPAVTGTSYRVFDYPLDFTTGSRDEYVEAAQVQAFYVINHLHDRLWQLGFDEAAGNFQDANYGRGGRDGDALKVEVQNDYTARAGGLYGVSAWYTGYGDGTVGRVSINASTAPPRKDGAFDAQVLIHEASHGLSTRLIGNGFGLTTTQSRGLAEGWSDFMPLALLSEAGDAADGTYPFGSYVGERFMQPQHAYFGIRRFPYCTDTNKAPQTLADIDPNQMSFPPDVPMDDYYAAAEADQIHNIGEIWCLMLWECRANLIERYGFAGNETMLQLVVDGMKLAPVNPTFIEARDAILQADLVGNGGTNQIDLWCGFAKRGLGYSAWVPGSVLTVGVIEGHDLPFDIEPRLVELSGDGDGYVEPGESGELTVTLTSREMALSNITVDLTAESSNATVVVSNAVLSALDIGGSATSTPPFEIAIGGGFPGNTDAGFSLHVESDRGEFDELLVLRIGNRYDYPPEITGIAVTNLSETSAGIVWETGIPADGVVEYGLSTNYGLSSAFDPTMRTNHLHELTGLDKGTVYHYRVVYEGTNGLAAYSADRTFRTRERVYVYADSTADEELGTIDAPYRSLQAAAEAAKVYGDDILVAMGTYTSSQVEAVLDLVGSDWDLRIKGGYSPDFNMRDSAVFVTTIDGQRQRRGIRLDEGASLEIDGLTITRGQGEWGGGVHVRKSVFSADACAIVDNSSTNGVNKLGGGVYGTLGARVQLDACFVVGNRADFGGGVFGISSDTSIDVRNSGIQSNMAVLTSGGVEVELAASLRISGCTIHDNNGSYLGGGIGILPFCSGTLESSTVSSNQAILGNDPDDYGGGGVSVAGSSTAATLTMHNSLVWGNLSPYGKDLRCSTKSEVHALNCNIGDIYGTLTTSNNVISSDPLFANADAGDFHLLYGSPCIDAGMTNYGGGTVDMDGEPRPFGAAMDIGADEFTDADDDHMADYWEVGYFGGVTNADGTADGDADELSDFDEYMNQTDPHDTDTDDDLAEDGWEVGNGYDPLDPDMDNDGMWDGWEFNVGLNAFSNDAALNPDGDAHNNLCEFTADTDPHDDDSVLKMLYVGSELDGTRIDWKGGRDSWQWLECSTNLSGPAGWDWLFAFPPPRPLTNAIVFWGETNGLRFYRIRAERE